MNLRAALRRPEIHDLGIYGGATGVAALLTLVLTRELWRGLAPAAFGLWALVDPMLLPAASLVLLGIDHAIVKQLRVDREPLPVIAGGLLATGLPAALACLLAIGGVARIGFHIGWTGALLLTLVGEALILMVQTAFRASGAVRMFAVVLLSRNLLYLTALLALLHRQQDAPLGLGLVFLARGVCVLLVSVVALPRLRPVFRVSWPRYRDALRYGSPLLLTTFVYAVADLSDRWVLAQFSGVVAVGVYSLHLKVAAILAQAIVIPFGLWFPPERFKHIGDPDGGRRFFVRTAVLLALICSYLSGGVWLARAPLLAIIAPGAAVSPGVLACCLAGVVCLAMSQVLNVGLLAPGHTGKNVWCNGAAAAVTGLAALAAVPFLGMYGAAISRLVGGLALVGVTAVWSNRITPLPNPLGAMVAYFGCSAVAAFAIDRLSADHGLLGVAVALVAWTAATAGLGALLWLRVVRGQGGRQPPADAPDAREGMVEKPRTDVMATR